MEKIAAYILNLPTYAASNSEVIVWTIVGGVFVNYLWEKIACKVPNLKVFGHSKIDGVWVGAVNSKNASRPGPAINLYVLSERRGNVKVYIEHYKKGMDHAIQLRGCGIYAPPQLSIAYQFDSNKLIQSGTLTARLCSNSNARLELIATYSQYVEREVDGRPTICFISEEYKLRKIHIGTIKKARALIGKHYFTTYQDIVDKYSDYLDPQKL